MNKDKFIEEMLEEVKSFKDLTKEELPLIAKEHIKANIVKSIFDLSFGLLLVTISGILGYHLYFKEIIYSDVKLSFGIISGILAIFGPIITMCSLSNLMDYYLQPKLMAIKGILNLKDDK